VTEVYHISPRGELALRALFKRDVAVLRKRGFFREAGEALEAPNDDESEKRKRRDNKIVELFAARKKPDEIARAMDCSVDIVRGALGLPEPRRAKRTRRVVSVEGVIEELHTQGLSFVRIAKQTGRSVRQIRKVLDGVRARDKEQRIQRVLAVRKDGISLSEIAVAAGVSKTQAFRILKEHHQGTL
jgi:DNA invertase Pin-like site-specific DNA recombinase